MDHLIQYRNERKNEGATPEELKPIDERIQTMMETARICVANPSQTLAMGDVLVFYQDRTCDVAINIVTETVGDVIAKAAKSLGIVLNTPAMLVHGGKHLDPSMPLGATWIRVGAYVTVCAQQGCNGLCPSAGIYRQPRPQSRSQEVKEVQEALARMFKGPPTKWVNFGDTVEWRQAEVMQIRERGQGQTEKATPP